jgi:hypothetical protein
MYHVRQSVYAGGGIYTTILYYGSTNIDPALCILRSEAQETLLQIYGTVTEQPWELLLDMFANKRYGMLYSEALKSGRIPLTVRLWISESCEVI